MIADRDFRSVESEPPRSVIIRTPSTVKLEGNKALITGTDVPGGNDESCKVGFGAARSSGD
jgi:hypothetical protein